MYSQNKVVGETLNEKYTKKKILKHLSADPGVLHETSKYPKTLVALDLKQYDNDTLFYITDNAYEFEIDMEQLRIKPINGDALRGAKGNMVSSVI